MYKKPTINLVIIPNLPYPVIFLTFMDFPIDNPG